MPFHNRSQRWAWLCTHRRAGKTVALVNDVIVGALQCKLYRPQLAYVGPTYTQAKRIAWQYLKDYSAPYLQSKPSESELKVTLHGDRTIYCLGADNADSLRGMYLDGGVGDEYALFRPSVFSQIIRPALSDRNGWWVFSSTPRGKNMFYKGLKEAQANPSTNFSMVLTASASGILPAQELIDLRNDMDPEEYAQEYECSFDAALKGAIYADEINQMFADARVKPSLYDPALTTHVVYDLGFTDATVAIFWQENPSDNSIRVVNVTASMGQAIHEHIDDLFQLAPNLELGGIYLPHDAKAKNLQTGRSIVETFLKSPLKDYVQKPIPIHKVRDRIAATRQLFPRIYIDSTCEDLIEALKGYRREWDENLLSFKDQPLHDWCSDYADAFGYMCMVAVPRFQRAMKNKEDEKEHKDSAEYRRRHYMFTLNDLHADRQLRQSQRRLQ